MSRVKVKWAGKRSHFVPICGGLAESLQEDAAELGLSAADLLLLERGVLFVEGPHNVAVIDEWLGDRLRTVGVRVIPAHGTESVKGLLESEVLAVLGIRMAVLLDAIDHRTTAHHFETKEQRLLHRLEREAELRGKDLTVFGLRKRDILQYIPDEICAAVAPAFPGWAEVVKAWRREPEGTMSLKEFVTKRPG